ncbi:MAG TPA: alpha/beta fold hydrolase [Streptosporangiaceae bacterium]
MTSLAYRRSGSGEPLVLLHALGSSRQAWDPVTPALARHFDVIAVDLPGFGESAPLPGEPSPAALAAAVAGLLDELGVPRPHVAGNSLGGWVAMELARRRPLASVTLLSPAGLWRGSTPYYCRISLRATRWLARYAAGPLCGLVRFRPGRVLILGQTHGRPGPLTAGYAQAAVRTLGSCPGFGAVLRATLHRRILVTEPVGAPVTVAIGDRDRLLRPRQARHLDQLPPGTHTGDLPGCGHLPMADDPGAVTALIIRSAARAVTTAPALGQPASP